MDSRAEISEEIIAGGVVLQPLVKSCKIIRDEFKLLIFRYHPISRYMNASTLRNNFGGKINELNDIS